MQSRKSEEVIEGAWMGGLKRSDIVQRNIGGVSEEEQVKGRRVKNPL